MYGHIQLNYRFGRKLFNHYVTGLKVKTVKNHNLGWILVNGIDFL